MADEAKCENHSVRLEQAETRLNKIDDMLDKVRNRLPVWATLIIAALTAAVAWFAK
jgi:hypothetical protein